MAEWRRVDCIPFDESGGGESNNNGDDDASLESLILLSLSYDSSDSPNSSGFLSNCLKKR